MRATSALLLIATLVGCSTSSELSTTLVLLPGQETDAFTRTPKPERLEVSTLTTAGTTPLVTLPWPSGEFDIGDLGTAQHAAFQAVGRNTAGQAIVRGRTLGLQFAYLDGAQVPLFMGRVGELARPPESLSHTCTDGIAEIVDDQLLVLAGGTDAADATGSALSSATASAYDLVVWGALGAAATLPRAPASMAVVGLRYGLLIDASGATWVDFDSTAKSDPGAPSGMAYSDVAGGKTVYGAGGEAYVIGAARRAGQPSTAVLRVNTDLSLTALDLTTPRLGASATWVPGRGLLVAGGSSTGPGAELLASGSSTFASLPFESDATSGAGATALESSRVLLAGGQDPQGQAVAPRLLDLSCTASTCPISQVSGAARARVRNASAWALSPSKALLMGTAPDGEADAGLVRVTVLTLGSPDAEAVDVPMREPRKGATATLLPTGMVAIAGGRAPDGAPVRSIEVFIPPE